MSGTRAEPIIRRSPTLALAEVVEKARGSGQDVLSLSTPTFPEIGPASIQRLAAAAEAMSLRLSAAEGHPLLREAARRALFGRWSLPEHHILISAGAKAALFSVLRMLLAPASRVVVIAPAWPSYADLVRLAGHELVLLETHAETGFAIEEAELHAIMARTSARAIALSNPSNPTGRVCTPAEIAMLQGACERHGALLVIDESFSHIMFDSAAWERSVGRASQRLVLVNSFSKNFHLQGLRVAAAMVHEQAFPDVVACHQTLLSAAPSLSQAVALATLQAAPGPVSASAYRPSRRIALEIIERAGWPCPPGEGTFYLFPRLSDAERTFERMRAVGLYSLEGAAFGEAYRDHLRLCFGKPEAEMAAIARRLEAAGLIAGG